VKKSLIDFFKNFFWKIDFGHFAKCPKSISQINFLQKVHQTLLMVTTLIFTSQKTRANNTINVEKKFAAFF
jgi:hypothetical protein